MRIVGAGVLLWTTTALAQVPGEEIARRAFEEGSALEKKGDFAGALAKFKESEQIKPTLGNRYHKAYCLEMTGKLAAALTEYEGVEKSARDANKSELAEAARVRVEPLRSTVPQLSVKLVAPSPKDSEVTLDGAPMVATLLEGKAFRVDTGEHVVAAHAPTYESFTKRFTMSEGGTSSIEISLVPTAKPSTPTSDAPSTRPESDAPSRSRTLPVLTTGGAIVLAGAGVLAFVVAGQKQDDLEKTCHVSASTTCSGDRGPTRTFDALALGSWIGAAGLAALSVVLWTSTPKPAAASAQARVAVKSSWLGLEGTFE